MKFKLAYYIDVDQHVNHQATGTTRLDFLLGSQRKGWEPQMMMIDDDDDDYWLETVTCTA